MSIDDYSAWSGRAIGFTPGDFYATVGVPLRAAGEVIGVIGLAYREPGRTFGPAQVALIERFAQLASLALENARLYSALQQSEELHRQIVDCSTDLISVVDLEGTIVVMSPSAFGTLGISPQDMVGTYFAGLVHPDDLADAQEMFSKAVEGTLATTTVRVLHADGSWVLLDAIASVIVGPDGQPQHILATGRDVTDSQRLEEQLRQAQKMEAVGRLAGGIAHDFNNLLTAIRGYAELMLIDFDAGTDPGATAPSRSHALPIERASLTGQLLAFSRKQVLQPQLIDLNEIVEGMETMLRRMLGEDVLLSTTTRPGARPDPGRPDPARAGRSQPRNQRPRRDAEGREPRPAYGGSAVRRATTSCRTPTSFRARTSRSS